MTDFPCKAVAQKFCSARQSRHLEKYFASKLHHVTLQDVKQSVAYTKALRDIPYLSMVPVEEKGWGFGWRVNPDFSSYN